MGRVVLAARPEEAPHPAATRQQAAKSRCPSPEGEGGPQANPHSAASICPSIRRDRSDSSSYASCQSVGPLDGMTWTAVTLYSGQLVAQSLNSVVTTLACVAGWWKVV